MNKRIAVATVGLTLLFVSPLLSHDFWLVPNAFRVALGDDIVVHGQTSSEFPTSLSAITVDRVASARIIMDGTDRAIEGLSVEGPSLRIQQVVRRAGQAVVAVAVAPRNIPESAESFRAYLTLEGAPEALARYEREGLLPTDSILRRYAKYAKTLVEVGSGGPRAAQKVVGHPLEFVPRADPTASAAGSSIRFQVLFLGEPLAGLRGHASVAEGPGAESAYGHAEFETDARGEFTLELAGTGIWNVRALHVVPAPVGSGADWDVHWATLVWGVDR